MVLTQIIQYTKQKAISNTVSQGYVDSSNILYDICGLYLERQNNNHTIIILGMLTFSTRTPKLQ